MNELTLPARMSWAEYSSRMRDVGRFHKQFPFYVGDLLAYGEQYFGEKASQVLNETGLAPETLANYKSVAKRIGRDERADVPFTVYQDIVGMPREERDRIVTAYQAGKMGRNEIRALKAATNGNGARNAENAPESLPTAKAAAFEALGLAMAGCASLFRRTTVTDEEWLEALDTLMERAAALREAVR